MNTTTPTSALQTDIGGLRAISVLMVVLYHFNWTILGAGFVGVGVFSSSPAT